MRGFTIFLNSHSCLTGCDYTYFVLPAWLVKQELDFEIFCNYDGSQVFVVGERLVGFNTVKKEVVAQLLVAPDGLIHRTGGLKFLPTFQSHLKDYTHTQTLLSLRVGH